jgi:hypothetical protein
VFYLTVSEERKSLFAKRTLVEKLREIAASRGISLYRLVNTIFEHYTKLYESRLSIEEVFETVDLVSKARNIGFALLPVNTWCKLVESASSTAGALSSEWRDLGTLVAKQLSGGSWRDTIAVFSRLLEYMGIRDVIIRADEGNIEVKVADVKLKYPYSDLVARLIEGFLVGLGYSVTASSTEEGVVTVKAKR